LPISLHADEVNKLDAIVAQGRPLQRGHYLYRANDVFKSVFAVRSGSFKTFSLSPSGEEQVTGFYLPGEILGLDGISDDLHRNSAIALETSSICEIPFNKMESIAREIPALQRRFFKLMSKEITNDQQLFTLLSRKSAMAKIASFLLGVSSRHQQRHLSATSFQLSMSRSEIANYLGLTLETTSRVFTKLQKDGLIDVVARKNIDLKNMEILRETALSE
jgi:CRP/FNR family transcriptional regulator